MERTKSGRIKGTGGIRKNSHLKEEWSLTVQCSISQFRKLL